MLCFFMILIVKSNYLFGCILILGSPNVFIQFRNKLQKKHNSSSLSISKKNWKYFSQQFILEAHKHLRILFSRSRILKENFIQEATHLNFILNANKIKKSSRLKKNYSKNNLNPWPKLQKKIQGKNPF